MSEPTPDTLMQRLDRLERENRWWKLVSAMALVGLTAMWLMGQVLPSRVAKVVEAKRFVLVDKDGRIRGEWGMKVADEFTYLEFLDKDGTPRVTLEGGEGLFPTLTLRGVETWSPNRRGGRGRARVTLTAGSESSLVLTDAGNETRAVLGEAWLKYTRTGTVEQRPASSLVLFDKDGKVIWKAP